MIKPVAIATVKATAERYFVYNISSYTVENTVYALYVNCAGHVVSCSCPDFKFRGHERVCKHCRDLQAQIDACKAARKAITQEKALIAEITAELEAERVNELAQIEAKEVALASAVEAVIEATTKPIQAAQEAMMHVAILTLPIKQAPKHVNRGFVMAPVAELGGRVVMLAS